MVHQHNSCSSTDSSDPDDDPPIDLFEHEEESFAEIASRYSSPETFGPAGREFSLRLNPHRAFVWPSAKLLSEYLLKHPDLIRNKRVVELGCGLGLPSFAAHFAGAGFVLPTDFDESYLRNLEELCRVNDIPCSNVALPGRGRSAPERTSESGPMETDGTLCHPFPSDHSPGCLGTTAGVEEVLRPALCPQLLDWLAPQSVFDRHGRFDVCIAADVNYSPRPEIIRGLVETVIKSEAQLVVLISRDGRLGLEEWLTLIKQSGIFKSIERTRIACEVRDIGVVEEESHSLFVLRR